MIYLTTGANGAGKTLLTLKDVREQQLKENRPVYYHGFEAGEVLTEWGWQTFDPVKWQDLPDGSICIFDECQNEFPAKVTGAIPEYINAIAQFRRKRGFDFWLVCPHPSLIHINVRRLIENPSWHRHLKRTFGSDMVSVLKFNAPNLQCEKPGGGASGQVSMRAYPKEVYGWYKSATVHTGKKSTPKQVYVLALGVLLVPLLFWFGYKKVTAPPPSAAKLSASFEQSPAVTRTAPVDYAASYAPRVPGLAYTAPRYDEITRPTIAPYPAACVQMGSRCSCYTQQGTSLQVTPDICLSIVKGGFFMDWMASDTPAARPVGGRAGPSVPSTPPPLASAPVSASLAASGALLAQR